ncbi:MAG: hypothetical protein JEZ00_21475 [Anaerolineaceae bacterium]|nr:hypothetical protein [Anaerolineaceae bacterium]
MLERDNYYTYALSMATQQSLLWKAEKQRLAKLIFQKQSSRNQVRLGFVGTVVNKLLPSLSN